MLFQTSEKELEARGAAITTREIAWQPEIWEEAFTYYKEHMGQIKTFLDEIEKKHGNFAVIFTGAGTSEFVGHTILPYLTGKNDSRKIQFYVAATTDIVSNPYDYLQKDLPTVLVSFARSGNSPESLKTVELAKQVVDELYQITITCAKDGNLATAAKGDTRNLLLLMPERSNDKGFAMTGSYTCMTLTALLTFDPSSLAEKEQWVETVIKMGKDVIKKENEIVEIVKADYDRVVYIGSGSLHGLAREVQLKILELTAGKIATLYDSSLGLRHGPKSFINDKTLLLGFLSNNTYTRQYDVDILNELAEDKICKHVYAVGANSPFSPAFSFNTAGAETIPDAYAALPFAMVGQTIALHSAIKVGNLPDTPSPTGTVNRVVKGVTLHDYSK